MTLFRGRPVNLIRLNLFYSTDPQEESGEGIRKRQSDAYRYRDGEKQDLETFLTPGIMTSNKKDTSVVLEFAGEHLIFGRRRDEKKCMDYPLTPEDHPINYICARALCGDNAVLRFPKEELGKYIVC